MVKAINIKISLSVNGQKLIFNLGIPLNTVIVKVPLLLIHFINS